MDTVCFNKTFGDLMKFLQEEDVIQRTRWFLKQNGVNIYPKKFLGFFMIYFHHEELLDTSEISQELLKQINRCIRVYDSIRTQYKDFKLKIFHHVVEETEKWFDIWKKKDKYELVIPMVHMYHHLQEQKTGRTDWDSEIDNQRALIKSKIMKIEPNGQEIIDSPPRVQINKEAKENIINVVYKAYWDKFQESVKNKEWEQLIGFVGEINTILKDLVPHRTDFHQEMDDKMDISILKQRLENNAINEEDIFNLMEYIVNWIRQFQAPSDDNDTEEWWKYIQEQSSWDLMMRDFFMITFAKLDKIKIISNQIISKK